MLTRPTHLLDNRDLVDLADPMVNLVDHAKLNGDPQAQLGAWKNKGATTVQTEAAKPWISLFKDNQKVSIMILLQQFERMGDHLQFDYDVIDSVESALKYCMVGCFMGCFPRWPKVVVVANHQKTAHWFYMHPSGWMVFQFDTAVDWDRVLGGGPYYVVGSTLFLKFMPS